MRPCDRVNCSSFPCPDVNHDCFRVPAVQVRPADVSIVVVGEAAAPDPADDFYAAGDPLFARTTVLAFQDAGARVSSVRDILRLGVYLTTAVKCAKTSYAIKSSTTQQCSHLLEAELALFPNARVLLLMGDVAIKAVNAIARRAGQPRVIPAGSTYRLRGGHFFHGAARALPSYLQAGPSFFIEKSKRRMIAEDIATALSLVG